MNMQKLQIALACIGVLCTTLVSQAADEKAPESYQVKFETTAGDFTVDVTRAWAPKGADRFYTAVKAGFYDDTRFFRVIPGFVVQFGINGDPMVQKKWRDATIADDPVKESNKRGTLTFATSGPNSRTTQLFINYQDNGRLDNLGFAPFGKVSEGMKIVDKINAEYREEPSQGFIQSQGNAYLKTNYPNLDYIKKAKIVEKKKE
ncbi:MAG: peptidylprolyl isomerase [Planctomycetaceae bacterium]|nr:peptidylprolyl isomerase [Planctomycetaceae bacterium]